MAKADDRTRMEVIALDLLAQSDEPTGARRLAEVYRREKIDLAEATAGRYLRSLDEMGLTQTVGVRGGRVLTEAGRRRLRQIHTEQQIHAQSALLVAAADVRTVDELIDLLHVRRAAEAEAARLAATRATDAEIARLEAAAAAHTDCFETCDRIEQSHNFHLLLAQASRNRMLIAVIELLLDPKNDKLAVLLDRIAVDAGVVDGMVSTHPRIATALRRRDPDKAERLMREHVEEMISTANQHKKHQLSRKSRHSNQGG